MSLKFVIEDAVAEAFPRHRTAVLRVSADAPLRPRPGAAAELSAAFAVSDAVTVRSIAHWREVFSAMGAKPKYGPSIEKLRDLVERQGGALGIPLDLVELYCWYSLVTGVPMAGYRPERIEGDLRLAMPGPGVPFTALGQRSAQEKTKSREVAYVDDTKAICRYWNYRDCDQTKLVDDVREALFVFDVVDGIAGVEVAERFPALLDNVTSVQLAVASRATRAVVV